LLEEPADAVPSAEGVESESEAVITPVVDTARPVPTDTAPTAVEVAYGSRELERTPDATSLAEWVWAEGLKVVGTPERLP
jgi:hypothetical protein